MFKLEIDRKGLAEWLLTRPQCVQELAKEFPIGMRLNVKGEPHFVVGYNESDMLLLSPVSVCEQKDYDKMLEAKEYVCAKHYRKVKAC